MTPAEVVGFLAHCRAVRPHVARRVELAARVGAEWARAMLGDGWTGPERRRLEVASGIAAAELQIICELHAASMGVPL